MGQSFLQLHSTHLSDMFFNQVIICVLLSSTKPEHESKHTPMSLSGISTTHWDVTPDEIGGQLMGGGPHLLLVFDSSSLSYSATISSSSSLSPRVSGCSSLLSWSNLNASSSSELYKGTHRDLKSWLGVIAFMG